MTKEIPARRIPNYVVALMLCVPVMGVSAAERPEITVENVRQVYHNGEHNAFTDLIEWQGAYWLTFRSCPDGHMVHPTASVRVLRSTDTKTWEEVHQFSVPRRDTRDPHFLAFKGKLFVYTGTWYSGDTTLPRDEYDINKHLGYAAWTADGQTWEGPRALEGTYGHYIWRAAAQGDMAYLCGRRFKNHVQVDRGERHLMESAMLKSDDGLVWRFHSLFQETEGNETAFQFDDAGKALAVCRRQGTALLATASPPYTDWNRTDLGEHVGGPLLVRWGDRWLVGGRRNTPDGPRTTLYWLQDGELHAAAELPSGGDNSYPGFIALDATHAVVSWYSSHEENAAGEKITAIYMADLMIEP